VGVECVRVIGVRSLSREEQQAAREDDLSYIEAGWVDLREHLSDIVDALDGPLYLSLDMDAIDPAFAPGVGTPEPFGMTPYEVLQVLNFLSDRLVGFDCVETCPPADNGNTAALAARLVRHALGAVVKAQTAGE
jgi:arginase family enzyme